ncbi:GNAT family N-acetyltransferase [Aeromonas salmonicida]|uniref:GNAT family N-acetyltransferase n=1 Tax=Aeromonas salmonicida TaxID=645 RepID=UPI00233023D8|nr:GNAT family N-acetyltransferase [Aeromonas salmonicida]WCH24172.1 GNAT family N-acetyltransferase [Aeromonas salmonicida]
MELLIERALWQPHWSPVLQAWQQQGHCWKLLLCKESAPHLGLGADLWSGCPPDGILSASGLLAAWLDGDLSADPHVDPSRQILISASPSLLTLAKESGLLTLGPLGADLVLTADDDMGAVLKRLLARRLAVPLLRESGLASPSGSPLVLRPLLADDEAEVVRYCADEALSRYTLNIPHPYPPEGARDWLASSGRKGALGLGWSWAMTLPQGAEVAPLVGVISLHWNGELAWWVGVPWQNRGLATRAAQLVKSFAFDTLQLPALTARHMPGNLASGRVMAKLGMHYRGLRARTAQQPCEVSYWRLDRAVPLPEPVMQQLAPWLANERVAVAILHGADAPAGSGHDGSLQLTLFLDDKCIPTLPGAALYDGALFDIVCHPLSQLEQVEPEQLHLLGGLLLKDRDEQGLACLLQLTSLLRQGPVLLTRTQRQQRLDWIDKMARRTGLPAAGGRDGAKVAGRYHQLWLLVELPELIDELAGRWHQGPELALARLEQDDAELFAAYGEAITAMTPVALQGVLRLLAARFPESTLPFLDKGAQVDWHFVE